MNELIDFFDSQDVEYQRNVKLSSLATVGIGGNAKIIIFPKSKEQFTNTLEFLYENDLPYKVVGNMSNILPTDTDVGTIIVSTMHMTSFKFLENTVTADSGILFSNLILIAAKHSLTVGERLFGIPGTVGGMLNMNAGAYGSSVSDFLVETEVYDIRSSDTVILKKDDIAFYYRDSEIKRQNLFVLNAKFAFNSGESAEAYSKIKEIKRKRAESQPVGAKTLGSVFRKTDEFSASYLIDKCGLKGKRIGNVSVSEKHAGFFVNNGGTARDFLELADFVKKTVKQKYAVTLTEEFEYLS